MKRYVQLVLNVTAAMLLAVVSFYTYNWFSYSGPYPAVQEKLFSYFTLVLLPPLLLIFICSSFTRSLQKNIAIQRGATLVSLIVVCLAGILAWEFLVADANPPDFFPVNDKEATYTILHDPESKIYSIHYLTTSDNNRSWVCEQGVNKEVDCSWEYSRDVIVVIGYSPVDLGPYVGKNVKLTGSFIYARKQCVKEKCISFYADQRSAAFEIKTIEAL